MKLNVKIAYLKIILALTFLVICLSFGQTSNERIHAAKSKIGNLLLTYAGGPFKISSEVIDVDSSVGQFGIADGKIHNTYGTLTHCFLFVAKKAIDTLYRFSIGIYKDSTILWLSEPIPGEYFSGGFYGSLDLNKSGTVDIVTGLTYGRMVQFEKLVIFSWDGTHGTRIDDRDSTGDPQIDALIGSFSIVDLDVNGIYKITGQIGDVADGGNGGYEVERTATFSWNGTRYGEWKKKQK